MQDGLLERVNKLLIRVNNSVAINAVNVIAIAKGDKSTIFKMYNGRCHFVDDRDERDYNYWCEVFSGHLDMILVNGTHMVNIDAVTSVAICDKGVAINTVNDKMTIYHFVNDDKHKWLDHYCEAIRLMV